MLAATRAISPRVSSALLVFLIFFGLLNQRPAILQMVGELVLVMSAGLMALYLMLGYKVTSNQRKNVFVGLAGILCLYLAVQGLLLGTGVSEATLKNIIFIFFSALAVIFIREEDWESALKAFVYPVLFFSVSYLITSVLVMGLGVPLESLSLYAFHLAQGPSGYHITIYFPFSVALGFGDVRILGIPLARAIGYFREPGIFQVLVAISFFGLDYLALRRKWLWKTLLLLTLLLTFSTAGFGAFLAAAAYYYLFANRGGATRKRLWKTVGALVFLVPITQWFLFTDKNFGLMRKLSLGSGTVRVEETSAALAAMKANPLLGAGYGNEAISTINFMSIVGQIGLLGLAALLALIVVPNWDLIKRRDPALVFIIPGFLTMLVSQPLFDKPMFYLMLVLITALPRAVSRTKPSWLRKYGQRRLQLEEEGG